MNKYGWTSWGWLDRQDGEALRRWKWYGRDDLFVDTNDDLVLILLAGALEREAALDARQS